MSEFDQARELLKQFKGDSYLYGNGVLGQVGERAAKAGAKAVLVYSEFSGVEDHLDVISDSFKQAGVELTARLAGARPNAPREDLFRITNEISGADHDVIVSFGGGSTIDAAKAAEVLGTLGGEIDDYFGVGKVSETLKKTGKELTGHMAIQTVASSAAHLTKYSNITDLATGQKKLIVDPAIVPQMPVFDYQVTHNAPRDLTCDGGLDGIAHILEVLFGAVGKDYYPQLEEIARCGIRLVLDNLPRALENPRDEQAREALCLATDLGGYAIMIGGTNGGHLTSFSLVDVLSHGRACAIMNPYYTVFFAPAIEPALKLLAGIYREAGYIEEDISGLSGRELGVVLAEGMFRFARRIGFPTTLSEVPGFNDQHIDRALTAAKNPQLKMKLENMPVPLSSDMIDEYMGPILQSAQTGRLELIKNTA